MTTQQQVKRTNASVNKPHNKTSNEPHNKTSNELHNKIPNEPSDQLPNAPATRITYRDCLCDATPHTIDPVAQLLFTVLIIGGMVTFMATFNGLRQLGITFFFIHTGFTRLFLCVLCSCVLLSVRAFAHSLSINL